ncbi:MAG: DUF4383 domain-containing protein [Actinobacteria bacterium]|nr:DUF4383 domain-containing protein [Actinomycetota bacterium]
MATNSISGARSARLDKSRTPAQWYCLLVGLALLAAGALGFLVNSSFGEAALGLDLNDGELINGDLFLGLEVNGWHNIVHLASGLVLLLAAASRALAKIVALTFALVYVGVTVIGFLDGNDVLGIIPVNTADNLLHAAIAAVGLLAALISPAGNRP